jgi:O-antigen ligase
MAGGLMAATRLRIVSLMPRAVHVLIAAMLIVSFSVLFLDMGGSVMETMGRDPTLTGRTEIWKVVLGMRGNPVLGTGFESFWLGKRLQKIWSLYWWHPNEAHDGYLEIYLNLGWIGVTLLAIVVVTSYRKVVGAFRRDATIGRLTMAYFVVAVAYNFTESAIRTLSPVWITLLLAVTTASSVLVREVPIPNGNDDVMARPELRLGQLVGAETS